MLQTSHWAASLLSQLLPVANRNSSTPFEDGVRVLEQQEPDHFLSEQPLFSLNNGSEKVNRLGSDK